MLGKLDGQLQKKEGGLLPYTIYENELKSIVDLTMRPKTIKLLKKIKGNKFEI